MSKDMSRFHGKRITPLACCVVAAGIVGASVLGGSSAALASTAPVTSAVPVVSEAQSTSLAAGVQLSVSVVNQAVKAITSFFQPAEVEHVQLLAALPSKPVDAFGYRVGRAPGIAGSERTALVGTFRASSNTNVQSICISPGLGLGYLQIFGLSGTVGHLSPAVVAQIKQLLNGHPQPRNNTEAAALYLAVDRTALGASFQSAVNYYVAEIITKYHDRGVGPLFNTYMRQASLYSGAQTVKPISITKSLPGQKGSARFSDRTARSGVPGNPVTFTVTYGRIVSASRVTDGAGNVQVNFVSTSTQAVQVRVKVTTPNNHTILLSRPRAGQQTLVAQAPGVTTYVAGISYVMPRPTPVKATYVCTRNCNGQPPVTFCSSNAAGGFSRQIGTLIVGVRGIGHITNIPAGQSNGCGKFIGVDRQSMTFVSRYYLGGGKYSAWVNLPGRLVIDCPPWLSLAYSASNKLDYSVTTHYSYTITQTGSCKCVTPSKPTSSTTVPVAGKPVKSTTTVVSRQVLIRSGINSGHAADYVIVNGVSFTVLPGHTFGKVFTVTKPVTVITKLGTLKGAPIAGNSLKVPFL